MQTCTVRPYDSCSNCNRTQKLEKCNSSFPRLNGMSMFWDFSWGNKILIRSWKTEHLWSCKPSISPAGEFYQQVLILLQSRNLCSTSSCRAHFIIRFDFQIRWGEDRRDQLFVISRGIINRLSLVFMVLLYFRMMT